ncbi:MAG: hypothetical protein ACE5JD_12645 [Candidatus Methylomirabilia bacterium]
MRRNEDHVVRNHSSPDGDVSVSRWIEMEGRVDDHGAALASVPGHSLADLSEVGDVDEDPARRA